MATKYPISKAEFKRRVRLVYECWPKGLLQMRDDFLEDSPGCIMQVVLETDRTRAYGGLVSGVEGKTLVEIAEDHDQRMYDRVLAAVEAL